PATFESVLDACLGAGLRPHLLRWHYRSRHEGLIAYSNHQFYDNRLITFPGPLADEGEGEGEGATGVEFRHVPDGVYDRGGRRDVIFLSVGYGRDAAGKLAMHFGPLNREGGQRRLNVAVTRAREKLVVVSSIHAADLDVSASKAEGVRHLHRYLDFAERG